jgi:hypothetical protein
MDLVRKVSPKATLATASKGRKEKEKKGRKDKAIYWTSGLDELGAGVGLHPR